MRRIAIALIAASAVLPMSAAVAQYTRIYAAATGSPLRPAADTARDNDRRPGSLMAFAGVRPGMKIAEISPGGGYYTRLLSLAVGEKGYVYTVSGRPPAAVQAWAKDHPNVSVAVIQAGDALAPEPVDLVWTTLNYHDFKNNKDAAGVDAATKYNKAAFAALKPGGIYLVNDHAGAAGTGASQTSTHHRIDPAFVIAEVEAAGFKLAGKSSLLAHPGDDHSQTMNDTARGKTDQFVLKFVKPRR